MAGTVDVDVLRGMMLFDGLGDADLATLKEMLRAKQFAAGINVISEAEKGDVVFLLLDGTVKIYTDQFDGSEVILAFLGPGDTFGEMSLLGSAGRSASVVTLEACSCLAMDRSAFHACLKSINKMSYNLARIMVRRLRLANEQIQALSTLDVRGRVARQILAFAQQYGREQGKGIVIPLRLTQTDLASLVGASRERVNQVVVDFKENGFISVDGTHRVTVHDTDALVERCL